MAALIMMNEWCKMLTIKNLTEVNRTLRINELMNKLAS